MVSKLVDALIIGGGPAGLTTALAMARQQHTSVVFDSKDYRNERTKHMHAVLGFDHEDPKVFRGKARENILARYSTVQFADVKVEKVTRLQDEGNQTIFEAVDVEGKTWQGRKLVLATGVIDVYPDIPGYDECWGRGIFHCLFCDGYEERHSPSSGVLAFEAHTKAMHTLHVARNAAQITPSKVTIYTNGAEDLTKELTAALTDENAVKSCSIVVDSRRVQRLEKGPERAQVILHFEDGTSAVEGFLAYQPKCQLKSPFAQQLGLELTPAGDIQTTQPFGTTSVKGVFAAGDVVTPIKAVNNALFTGQMVGASVTAQLQAEKWGHQSLF